MDVARQWHQGIWYPRWAELANYGFGEPRFIFYPPLSWLLGAGLGMILPWHVVPDVFIWLSLVLAGVCMYQLARRWVARIDAIAAAVLFAVNPYHLVMVYYRSDFAELLASALFPLLILKALELRRAGWRQVSGFAVVFALIWLTNAPAAVIATYGAAVIVLVEFASTRDWRVLARSAGGAAIGFALGAFYILPAALERSWVQIGTVLTANLQPWSNFLFTHSGDPEFLLFNWKVSAVALLTIGVFAIAAVFVARRRGELANRYWPLAALGIVSVALMFSFTGVAWKYVPELKFVQFPWRWLLALDVVMVLFLVYAVSRMRRRWTVWATAGLLLCALGAWMTTNNWWDTDDVPAVLDQFDSDQGYLGVDEYVPLGCDHDTMAQNAPKVAVQDFDTGNGVVVDPNKIKVEEWGAERRVIRADVAEPVDLLVRLFPYSAWHGSVNGTPVTVGHGDENGQMLIKLPAGKSEVTLQFVRTWDRLAGGLISLLTAVALLIAKIFQ